MAGELKISGLDEILSSLDNIQARLDVHSAALAQIYNKLSELKQESENFMANVKADIDTLTAQVAQNTTVEQSAITLINGLAAQIAAAGTDPAKLDALQAQLKTSADALAAAVAANTVPPPPPPPPAPTA